MASSIVTVAPWQQPQAPPSVLPNRQNPLLAAPSVFYAFSQYAPFVDLANNANATPTGSVAADGAYGLVTSSGNYLTGSTARPKFSSSTFFFAAEIQIGAGVVSSTLANYTEAIGGSSLIRFDVWNNGGGVVGGQAFIYVGGAYRNSQAVGVNVGTVAAGQRFVAAARFVQPSFVFAFASATAPGHPSWSSSNTYGAPMGDGGAAMLLGKDAAGSHVFDGELRYVVCSQHIPSDNEVMQLWRNPWGTLLAPARRRLYFGAAVAPGAFLPPQVIVQQAV